MGITTALVTEDGRKLAFVDDPHGVVNKLLRESEDRPCQCLRYIDPYGDTLFNYLQAPQFLSEWDTVGSLATTTDAQRVFLEVRRLAEKVRDERHIYLKFIGD
jgi:hypothetical protein